MEELGDEFSFVFVVFGVFGCCLTLVLGTIKLWTYLVRVFVGYFYLEMLMPRAVQATSLSLTPSQEVSPFTLFLQKCADTLDGQFLHLRCCKLDTKWSRPCLVAMMKWRAAISTPSWLLAFRATKSHWLRELCDLGVLIWEDSERLWSVFFYFGLSHTDARNLIMRGAHSSVLTVTLIRLVLWTPVSNQIARRVWVKLIV